MTVGLEGVGSDRYMDGLLTPSTPSLEALLEEARRNSLTRDNPLLVDLPDWFVNLRDHQRVAIREALNAYEEGVKCVVVDAPTGSGKTLLGEIVRRLLPDNRQTTYICSSKALQDQVLRDYPYAKVLKGRSNYATERYPERWGGAEGLSCADCIKNPGDPESCLWCPSTHSCPYELAKNNALQSELAVLNTSYFLSECNGPGRFSRDGFVIADECDVLEQELMNHVEVRISERRLKQYGLGVPRYVTKEESWREWAEEAVEKVRGNPPRHRDSLDISAIRARKRHDILVEKLRALRMGLESGDWVYTGDRTTVAFKPVTVSKLGQGLFWQHGDKFLLMSATVISADELLESLGWEEDYRLVRVASTFKPENRKVVVWPVANVTRKTKEVAYPALVGALGEITQSHPDHRILVHSTSYELTERIVNELRGTRPLAYYLNSGDKYAALAKFLTTEACVLVAPSMDRGIDLPGDQCRVQVVCKVPWLSLDRQVTARLYSKGGRVWYAVQAIRTIVQMSGRAVRSEEDWVITYIIDNQFVTNLWSNNRRLFPRWWVEALEWRKANG